MVRAGEPSPHQPPMPKEVDAGRTWAEKYEDRKRQWCFQPVKDSPAPPVRDDAWARGPIDLFILVKLKEAKLQPAPQASAEVLARRLSYALTGLPPQAGDAALPFHDLVDRLLAAPQFGEHWARHWMDVVRYAETYGSEHDYLNPYAWRYRDYLVRAFNTDLPYDQFVQEQIAGDLLSKPRMDLGLGINESLLGTAFQRMSEFYGAPVDVMREKGSVLDWQIENVSKAFLGLTVACARCHDHKFDPISAADYYALSGVFEGARPVQNIIDTAEKLTQPHAELRKLKLALRHSIAERWLKSPVEGNALKKAIEVAKDGTLLTQLRADTPPGTPPETPKDLALEKWLRSGPGLPDNPARPGLMSLHAGGPNLVRAIQPAGWYSEEFSDRHGGSLRSPEFTLTKRNVSVLAGGTSKARLRLVVEGCQADIVLFTPANKDLVDAAPRWHTLRTKDQWMGLRAHLEIMTRDDLPTVGNVKEARKWENESTGRSSFGLVQVALHDDGLELPKPALPAELWMAKREKWDDFVTQFNVITRTAILAWRDDDLSDAQARLLQSLVEAKLLPNDVPAGSAIAHLTDIFRDEEKRIPIALRAPGVRDDRSGRDVPVLLRGDPLTPGEMVPRRMPMILGGRALKDAKGDRLALAMELTRTDNPLTARVMVNRVWHHLFGHGLVNTPDNFGRMGGKPSHPELLDHLAAKFMREGWSMKKLIRDIVMSRTWRLASEPPPGAMEIDPDNQMLSHANARRLTAESIRDTLLAVGGNLDLSAGGPSVYHHYSETIDPDKQPPKGPLDGNGRRSVYLEVRRNFPGDFLTVFDFPRPNNPTGARSVTNVPAQSITLLNDPLVHYQAEVWAKRITATPGSAEGRIAQMHRDAFGREPTEAEVKKALAFFNECDGDWRDLAHAMFNMKEFIFVR
jgi:hypothetical protein